MVAPNTFAEEAGNEAGVEVEKGPPRLNRNSLLQRGVLTDFRMGVLPLLPVNLGEGQKEVGLPLLQLLRQLQREEWSQGQDCPE